MNLDECLLDIAAQYDLHGEQLIAYAAEDKVGGYHTDERYQGYTAGSVWTNEGRVLYALVRYLQPKLCVEIGSWFGCSSTHIAEALIKNGEGKLICVDLQFGFKLAKRYTEIVECVTADLFDWTMPPRRVDFLFEDAAHTAEAVGHVWLEFAQRGKKGAYIVSHDAAHYRIKDEVRKGIEMVTTDYHVYAPEPDEWGTGKPEDLCGLAIWRKP